MAEDRVLYPGDVYRHFKDKLYEIIGVATHSESKEKYVVYKALYGDFGMYIRPYDMFMSEVDKEKYPMVEQKYRFEKVEDTKEEETVLEGVNPYLMEFLDMETIADKIEYLSSISNKIDDRLISDIAASLDLTIEEGNLDDRYISLISCLRTMARFECKRLR